MKAGARRSPLALAILALLVEAPMHPYRMQQLIRQRQKDEVINVRLRASLYQTIERLLRSGLIAVQETERHENRPERTVYRLTDKGAETVRAWMRAMLSTPAREFPEFPAALAHLPLLSSEEALEQLQERERALEEELAAIDAQLRAAEPVLPRLFVIEGEYLRAMRQAEVDWVRALIADLREGRITWSEEWLVEMAARLSPPRLPSEERVA
jgi:DNA-binding PadR family transcriptional regulator